MAVVDRDLIDQLRLGYEPMPSCMDPIQAREAHQLFVCIPDFPMRFLVGFKVLSCFHWESMECGYFL